MSAYTEDRFLGGRVAVRQPVDGFRSGLDAVMLAAAVPASSRQHVLELGSGAGVASLCLAVRASSCVVAGIEIGSDLVDLANENARTNRVDARVHFVRGNALSPSKGQRKDYDHVFVNPPFHGDDGKTSPSRARAVALHDKGNLGLWIAAGLKRVRSQGTLTAIVRADRLVEAALHLPLRGIALFPLWPRENEPARRVILQVRKGSNAPLNLLSGLVLHNPNGSYTKAANAVLRDGASLALESRRL